MLLILTEKNGGEKKQRIYKKEKLKRGKKLTKNENMYNYWKSKKRVYRTTVRSHRKSDGTIVKRHTRRIKGYSYKKIRKPKRRTIFQKSWWL